MKYITVLLFYFLILSQMLSQSENLYCVDVDYYNPRTGTESSYRLDAMVSSGRLIELNFPNGGHLDQDDFGNVTFQNGKAIAVIKGGKSYSIQLLPKAVDCFANVPKAVRCKGLTKSGSRCKNKTDNRLGYCWKHKI